MADDLRSRIAHLHRRAGFGARPETIDALLPAGYDAAVDALFDSSPDPAATTSPAPKDFALISPLPNVTADERRLKGETRKNQTNTLRRWWLDRMTATERPLVEKMTLFWHGHFATSMDKVIEQRYMLTQNELFRSLGLGPFEALTQAVSIDPAMLVWLDANDNRKGSPNENFARELMELFTIGIGNYTDADVREAARAFTGTRIDRSAGIVNQVPRQTDTTNKTILGNTRPFGFADTVNFLATRPETATFVSSKLWSRFAYPVASNDPIVSDIARAFGANGDLTATMKAIFRHPHFVSTQARQGLVKQPIEWVVGSIRALTMRANQFEVIGPNPITSLSSLNQMPFEPPSVGGWPQNGYWLTTATALARLRFASDLANRADTAWLANTSAASRPDALARQLSIDGWTRATRSGLTKADNPKVQLALALTSPEYVLA